MSTNKYMDSEDYKKSPQDCPYCGQSKVKYRIVESSCGGYEDYEFLCTNCNKHWWIDGIDS